jgi:hypothetical protein
MSDFTSYKMSGRGRALLPTVTALMILADIVYGLQRWVVRPKDY